MNKISVGIVLTANGLIMLIEEAVLISVATSFISLDVYFGSVKILSGRLDVTLSESVLIEYFVPIDYKFRKFSYVIAEYLW